VILRKCPSRYWLSIISAEEPWAMAWADLQKQTDAAAEAQIFQMRRCDCDMGLCYRCYRYLQYMRSGCPFPGNLCFPFPRSNLGAA